MSSTTDTPGSSATEPIAIVGLSALFPGSVHKQAFWRNIVDGRDFITDVPPDHWLIEDYYDPDPTKPGKIYTRRGAFLPKVPFNPIEFGLPPKNLPSTDTVQLLALLGAKQLLAETRSFQSGAASKSRTSVILGLAAGTELIGQMSAKIQRPHWVEALRREGLPESQVERICQRIFESYPDWNESTFPGLLANVTAGRIANRFDLGGANCVIDAACASSLAAITLAVDELRLGKTDLVISGGADALNDIFMFTCFTRTPAMSFSGDCRPFSDTADGTMMGEGLGLFALRRLSDAEREGDAIYALIKGIGASSDGNSKSVYAPRSEGQALAIRRSWAEAGCGPEDIELVEAHGTATKAGDAAEFGGLRQAFGENNARGKNWCALGSIKSQIGHTKSAAGAAGLFKTVLALRHAILPPTIKVDRPNPALEIEASPFHLNTQARPWIHAPGKPRRAGLSSFGFGGSNYHLTLEEYTGEKRAARMTRVQPGLLLASGATREALIARIRELTTAAPPVPLGTMARASWSAFDAAASCRAAVLASDRATLEAHAKQVLQKLSDATVTAFSLERVGHFDCAPAEPGRLAFLFPGQGSQYVNMGAELAMEFEPARAVWDRFATDSDTPLHRVVFPAPAFGDDQRHRHEQELTRTDQAQPAIGLTALAQLALLDQVGVKPNLAAGHSYGELVALHVAGAIADPAALVALSYSRGKLMAEAAASTTGAMTAVLASAAEVGPHLGNDVVIANHNSPRQVVVSGSSEAIAAFEHRLTASGDFRFQRLPVSTAFHSPLVASAAAHFARVIAAAPLSLARLPVYANLTGSEYPALSDAKAATLAQQLASPVLFQPMIEAMYAAGARLFLEVGPGRVLTRLVNHILQGRPHTAIAVDARRHDGVSSFFEALGRLAMSGVKVNVAALYSGFEDEMADPTLGVQARGVVMINGTNLGKPYPPASGATGCAVPNPERVPAAPPALAPTPPSLGTLPTVPLSAPAMNSSPASAPVPNDQLQRLALLEQVQRNLLEAQRHFQETLAQSHLAFLQTSEAVLRQIGGVSSSSTAPMTNGHAMMPTVLSVPVAPPPLPLVRPSVMRPPPLPTPTPPRFSMPSPVAMPPPVATPPIIVRAPVIAASTSPASVAAKIDYQEVILSTIAELTGYPVEMIEMEMELESGLGIDSIKKVEIFSALQAKIPEFKGANTGQVATLSTPRAILAFTLDLVGAPAAELKKKLNSDPSAPRTVDLVPVFSVEMVTLPSGAPRILAGVTHLVPDDAGVAEALQKRFVDEGLSAPTFGVTIPGEATRVVILTALTSSAGEAELDACVVQVFQQLRTLGQSHRSKPIELFFAQRLGGDFGFAADPGARAVLGAIAGLAKTTAREWPQATIRVIDLPVEKTPHELAAALFEEIAVESDELEVGLSESTRLAPRLRPATDRVSATHASKVGDVWIVSGGARGVTSACLKALARRGPLRLALLGRTAIDDPEMSEVRSCTTEAELKRAFLDEASGRGVKLKPTELKQQVDRVFAAREARATCAVLRTLGAEVKYFALDATDAASVQRVVQNLREEWGPIRGVVHAAGVLADKALHEKTDEQFLRVYRTKVDGFRALLTATQDEPLTALIAFSSVAARLGNAGQADYAAANEALNKLCQTEQRRRGDDCIVRTINWGPWDGGMVGAGLKAHFAAMGVPLISVEGGAEVFADLVTGIIPASVECVVGAAGLSATVASTSTMASSEGRL